MVVVSWATAADNSAADGQVSVPFKDPTGCGKSADPEGVKTHLITLFLNGSVKTMTAKWLFMQSVLMLYIMLDANDDINPWSPSLCGDGMLVARAL